MKPGRSFGRIPSGPYRSGLLAAMVLLAACSGSSAHSAPTTTSPATSVPGAPDTALVAKSPPGGAYSIMLPASWQFRDASYPSDHSTHLWYDPTDPLRSLRVVLSGCEGCVRLPGSSDPTPHPELALNPNDGVPTIAHLSPDEIGFQRFGTDNPFPDNGIVEVLSNGYAEVDLWLPPSEHATATSILNSFKPSTPTVGPPTTTTTTTATSLRPPPSCYVDPEGNCYHAGEYCPSALHGQTVQGSNGPIVCTDNNGWRWEPT